MSVAGADSIEILYEKKQKMVAFYCIEPSERIPYLSPMSIVTFQVMNLWITTLLMKSQI